MRLGGAVRRARSATRLSRAPSPADRWRSYLAGVEPALAAQMRLHRFAEAPVIGSPDTRPAALAVWIEGNNPDDDAHRATRAAISAATVGAAEVLSGPLTAALGSTRAEHVVLVRAGDILAPLALERLGQAVTLAPDAAVITCDEDELGTVGERRLPRFRPGPSPDRWLACDDSGSLLVVSREQAVVTLGELSDRSSWRHELALALAGPGSRSHAHVPMLLSHRAAGQKLPDPAAPDAIASLLRRWEPSARVEAAGTVRRVRRTPVSEPSVEIIVCFRDKAELTRRCVESVVTTTSYDRLALTLVDNGSSEPETRELLERLANDRRIRILRDDRAFNFAALNNAAVATTDADVVVFLNNDTQVTESAWLQTLVEDALRPEVGAVAPLLLYPDGAVQQAGAALGLHGYAGHPFAGLHPDVMTPFGFAGQGTRNWLAVSAACMAVQRSKFEAVGGFDESFVVAGNDVDLCLRLTSAGHRSLCVPHARLVHDESLSRGAHIDPGDFAASERSYGAFRTVGDPFYNPNLTLNRTDCGVRAPDEEVA